MGTAKRLSVLTVSVILIGLVLCQHAVHEGLGFRYFPFVRGVEHLILASIHMDCYFYNSTAQNRSDMHNPIKMLAVEGRLLQMVAERDKYFRVVSKWHYQHDLNIFSNVCNHGKSTIWLYKGPVAE